MTRKDYELIAHHLAADYPGSPASAADDRIEQAWRHGYSAAITRVCAALAADNPNFDGERFIKACQS